MTIHCPLFKGANRPKSVHNRCVIDVLMAFLCCQLVVEFSVGKGTFVTGLSQISFSFSSYDCVKVFPLSVVFVRVCSVITFNQDDIFQDKGTRPRLKFLKSSSNFKVKVPVYTGKNRV